MTDAPACSRRVGIYFHVGIYFPGGHAFLFAMIKTKIPGPSMYSPGAFPRRVGVYFHVGIYFPGGHALLFAMIKKKFQAPACSHRVGIYFRMHLLSG